ncbi:MAG: NAD-dependent epimerase/dehydratase family protein [Paracoccaceae bacterium]
MANTILVLGANGLVGGQAAKAFAAAGWQVRKYRRGTDMAKAAQGADVIFNGLNPPNYHDWANIIPAITRDVIAAGLASGATVLQPGTVYVYGSQPGPWNADTPQKPASRKGGIRVQMEADFRAATKQGLRVIILRAGDFIDPEAPRSLWNMISLKYAGFGRIISLANRDTKRAYAYLPDLARAFVALAERRAELPVFADIPFVGYTLTMQEVADTLERLTGRRMKLMGYPWWLMRLTAPLWEMARELVEMRYLWRTSHGIDPQPLAKLLPDFHVTPLDDVLRAELAILAPKLLERQGITMSTQTGR